MVKIDEPEEIKALMMMRALASNLEKHHCVQILDEALDAAVRLSHRYIPERQLPDKAVSLTDTACARVAISQHAVPPELEDCRRRIEALKTEQEIVSREAVVGVDHKKREAEIAEKLDTENKRRTELDARWAKEKELVTGILDIRAQLRKCGDRAIEQARAEKKETAQAKEKATEASGVGADKADGPAAPKPGGPDGKSRDQMLKELAKLQQELSDLQGERPLILPCVDAQAVGSVVADWTGIPVGRMVKNEIDAVLRLPDRLRQRVIGQDHALEAIAKRLRTSRAGIENPNKPIAVMFLVGPSGVGKTETALALAEALYGGENNLITINMSEFQEAHTVSTLKGSPPGYVGYGEGGVLTEAVRRRPYSIVLLDEVEKAHRDVHEIFFQVFDKGQMEDAEGRLIDFRNTIILLTSNIGTDLIMEMCKDPKLMPESEGICKALRKPLLKIFPAALLGRLAVVPYYPISDETMKLIIRLQLDRIGRRTKANHKVPFSYDDKVVELIAGRCTEVESGARAVDAILTNTLLPEISQELLTRLMDGKTAKRVHIGTKDNQFTYSFN